MPWQELPALSLGDQLQVTTYCQLSDQVGINVYHFKVIALGDVPTAVFGKFMEVFAGNNTVRDLYALLLANSATFMGYRFQRLWPIQSVAYFFAQAGGTGLAGVQALPRQAAGFLRKIPNVPGRRKGGRAYIPFPAEDDNETTSIPSADYVARLDNLAGKVLLPVSWGAGGGNVANPSIYRRSAPAASPGLSGFAAVRKWATQRRRGSFGRVNQNPFT